MEQKQLSPIQEQVLNGLMLGDATINRGGSLGIERQIKDKDYLISNYLCFKEFCLNPPYERHRFDNRTEKTYHSCLFLTRSLFKKYRATWYPNGKKEIPKDFKLTPLSAAIWFADDGTVRYPENSFRLEIQMATNSFSLSEVKLLANELASLIKEFNQFLDAKAIEIKQIKKNGLLIEQYIILLNNNASRFFLRKIMPFFPSSIERKCVWKHKPELNNAIWKDEMTLDHKQSRDEQIKKLYSIYSTLEFNATDVKDIKNIKRYMYFLHKNNYIDNDCFYKKENTFKVLKLVNFDTFKGIFPRNLKLK